MVIKGKKFCPTCGKTKKVDLFYNARARGDGKSSRCKECDIEAQKAYYKKNIKKKQKYGRDYYEKNKDKICKYMKEYGMKNKRIIRERYKNWYKKKKMEENIKERIVFKSIIEKIKR